MDNILIKFSIELIKENVIPIAVICSAILGLMAGFYKFLHLLVSSWIDDRLTKEQARAAYINDSALANLRSSFELKLENFRNNLSISNSASRIIIEKRLGCYEDLFLLINESISYFSRFAAAKQRNLAKNLEMDLITEFFSKAEDWGTRVALSQVYLPEEAFNAIELLARKIQAVCVEFVNEDYSIRGDELDEFHHLVYNFETIAERDIANILETGSLSRRNDELFSDRSDSV